MGLGTLIELSPALLSLPTLLVSLTFTNYSYNPWYGNKEALSFTERHSVPAFQGLLFGSLSLLIVSGVQRLVHLNQRQLISSPVDDDEKEAVHDQSFIAQLLNCTIFMLIPLSFLFIANSLLLPIRLASLLVVEVLISRDTKVKYRSLKLDQQYSMGKSIVAVIFSKYQSIVIYLVCFVYDLFESLWLSNGFNKSVILGYVLLSIPLTTFLNPFSNETIAKNVRVPDLNISIVFTIGSLIVLFAHEFNDLNFKMLFVALGSLLIWIVSQLDFENIGRIGKSHRVFNTSMFTHDYKLNLFVLNLIMAAVQHVALNMGNDYGSLDDSTTTTMDLVKSNLFDFLLNVLLIIFIKPQDARPVESKEESSASDSQTKEKGVSFVSLLIQLVKYEDSRSIFNFLLLNMSFMFIQILYSFRSKSLSLLSDSLHMFLDCTSLFLGMMASVVAKNNTERPSIMYPFGLARIETLSGFTNGSLLLGIVFGIFNQAVQRIMNPVPLERTTELLVVSILGLLVNLVGIFAFNHGGDAHGHGHSHSHLHMHSVAQDHEDEDEHEHDHGHEHEHAHKHEHNHSHADDSSDEEGESGAIQFKNDNMHGIFLHIMADTLGSVGVVISTLVVKYAGWSIVDPLTSIFIATLILLSSFPLLKSSASNLLLSLEDNSAEKLKQVLDEVRNVPGVKSYSTPRFWPQDDSSSKLVGYLHVQYYRTEDSTSIRHKIVKILEASPILDRCYLQVENEIDDCWCHKKGIFNTDS